MLKAWPKTFACGSEDAFASCAQIAGGLEAMLADHAELTREHLSELENGHKEIGVRALEKITLALGVSLQRFFDGV